MKELPRLIELHKKHQSKGLQLIGINIDKDGIRIKEARERYAMPWPQYLDQKGFDNDILIGSGVVRIPTYFLIDRLGILRSVGPGAGLAARVLELLDDKGEAAQPVPGGKGE